MENKIIGVIGGMGPHASNRFLELFYGYKIQLYKSEQIFPLESFAKVSDVLDAWHTSFFEGWRLHLKKNKDSSLFHYEINKFLKASEVRHGDFFYHGFLKSIRGRKNLFLG